MKIITPFILLFLCQVVMAQKQNNTWCFGRNAMVDFNTTNPLSDTSMTDATEGGAATVSNRHTGQLMFYTDGVTIWDRTHVVMPNGIAIGNDAMHTCAQGSVIVPHPGDSNLYYVFTQEDISGSGGVYYNIVDMRLNSGKGDIVAGQKKLLLANNFVEGMTTVLACDGQWLVLFERDTETFVVYKITAVGINTTPVKSKVAFPQTGKSLCGIKVSPDAKHVLFSAYNPYPGYSYASVADFNVNTGVVSNGYVIDDATGSNYYSSAFSPDGTKAYIGTYFERKIYQFDLSQTTPAAVIASKKFIYNTNTYHGDLQLGPDSNIYISLGSAGYLDKISNSNSLTPTYTANAIVLAAGTTARLSLPQSVLFSSLEPKNGDSVIQVAICPGNSYQLNGRQGADYYLWHDNSTAPNLNVTAEGTYWVKSFYRCEVSTDTFIVTQTDIVSNLGNDTTICAGVSLLLQADTGAGFSYLWNNGNTTNRLMASSPGQYHVTVSAGNCTVSDTVQIKVDSAAYFFLGNDTAICMGTQLLLNAPDGFESYSWNTGQSTYDLLVDENADYALTVKNGNCIYTDSIQVLVDDTLLYLGNDTVFCTVGQYIIDASSIAGSTYTWSTGAMTPSVIVSQSGLYWVIVNNRCGTFTDSVEINFKGCDCDAFVASGFTPDGDGLNDRLTPIINCDIQQYRIMIYNRRGQLVFQSLDPAIGWDGYHKGQKAASDTYFYQLYIRNTKGQKYLLTGDVVLIR